MLIEITNWSMQPIAAMLSQSTATTSWHTLNVSGVGVLPTQRNVNYPPMGMLLWSQQQKRPNDLILSHKVVTSASRCEITSHCNNVGENWSRTLGMFSSLFSQVLYTKRLDWNSSPLMWVRFGHGGVPLQEVTCIAKKNLASSGSSHCGF